MATDGAQQRGLQANHMDTHNMETHKDVLGAPTHTQSGGGFLLGFAALKVRDEDHGSS